MNDDEITDEIDRKYKKLLDAASGVEPHLMNQVMILQKKKTQKK
jgi:hypothetical protein